MDGDDAIKNLATAVDTLAGTLASGVVTMPGVGTQSSTVTFPAGRFTAPPRIALATTAGASTTNPCLTAVNSGHTASSCVVVGNRASGGAYEVFWIAHL
jgi:hypothetical protein